MVFWEKYYKNIDDGKNNALGLIWDDKSAQDDLVIPRGEMYTVVNKPVKLIINSRDVVHDVGLAHFRLKMDAVLVLQQRCGLHLCILPKK